MRLPVTEHAVISCEQHIERSTSTMNKKTKSSAQLSLDRVLSFCISFVGTMETLKFINKTYVSLIIPLVRTLKLKDLDTPMAVIIQWMEKCTKILHSGTLFTQTGCTTYFIKISKQLIKNHTTFSFLSTNKRNCELHLQQLVGMIPSVFPNLRFLNIQMCQEVFSLPITPVPFKIKIGGCLGLCNNPEIYNYLRPAEFVLTHAFMIKYGYNDSFLFAKSDTWLKNLFAYEYFTAMPFRSVVKVSGVFFPPTLCRKGKIFQRTMSCMVHMNHDGDIITWKLKKNRDGFWRTSRIDFKF